MDQSSASPSPSGPVPPPEAIQIGRAAGEPPRPQVVIMPQPTGAVRRWFGRLGWVAFLISLFVLIGLWSERSEYFNTTGGIQEKYHSRSKTADQKIAIIDISGIITDGDDFVKKQIDRVRSDTAVKAVVVRIDSPGGTITGADYILHHLKQLKTQRHIPVVVSMGAIAASGGYYVAMAVEDTQKSIYAEPTTTTGSIGVIIPHFDLSGLLASWNIKNDSIASHPYKQMLSMTKEMTSEEREILKRYVDEAFQRFKDVIKSGRPAFKDNQQRLDQLATGEIFSATQARERGLVDELGFIEDAIERAAELAKLSPDNVRVVQYKKPISLWELMSLKAGRQHTTSPWNSLLESTIPRAYYLMTSLPPLMSTGQGP